MYQDVLEKIENKKESTCNCKHEWFDVHIQKGPILTKLEGVSMAWCDEKNMYISKSTIAKVIHKQ